MKKIFNWFKNLDNLLSVIILFAALYIFITHCYRIFSFTTDDAFITFRYSKNLVEGFGPNFNRDFSRAEGYTGFLWMILMGIPFIFNVGPVIFSKILGIVFTLSIIAVFFSFLKFANKNSSISFPRTSGSVMVLFYLMLPETAIHAVSGMETALFTLSLFLMTFLSYLAIIGVRKALIFFPFIALITGLIRPESNIIVMLFSILIFIRLRNLFSVNSSQKYPSFFNNSMTCQHNNVSRSATPR
jgi:arabinofuranosyltransferase